MDVAWDRRDECGASTNRVERFARLCHFDLLEVVAEQDRDTHPVETYVCHFIHSYSIWTAAHLRYARESLRPLRACQLGCVWECPLRRRRPVQRDQDVFQKHGGESPSSPGCGG